MRMGPTQYMIADLSEACALVESKCKADGTSFENLWKNYWMKMDYLKTHGSISLMPREGLLRLAMNRDIKKQIGGKRQYAIENISVCNQMAHVTYHELIKEGEPCL